MEDYDSRAVLAFLAAPLFLMLPAVLVLIIAMFVVASVVYAANRV